MAQKTWWLEGEPDTMFEPRDEKFRAAAAAARAASAAALLAGGSSSSAGGGGSGGGGGGSGGGSISSPLSLSSSMSSSGGNGNGVGDFSASTLAWALEAAREELTARLLRCPGLVEALLTSSNEENTGANAASSGLSSETSRVVVQQLLEALLPALLASADGRVDYKAWAQAKLLIPEDGEEASASSSSPVVLHLPAALHRAAAAVAVPSRSSQKAPTAAGITTSQDTSTPASPPPSSSTQDQETEPLEVAAARCRCLEELAHLLVLLLGKSVAAAAELSTMWNAQGVRLAAKATRASTSGSNGSGGTGDFGGRGGLLGNPSGIFGPSGSSSSSGGGGGFGSNNSNNNKSNSASLMGVAPPLAPGDLVRLCEDRRVASKLHRLCGRAADSPNGIGLHEAMARELGQCTRVVGVKRLKATNEVSWKTWQLFFFFRAVSMIRKKHPSLVCVLFENLTPMRLISSRPVFFFSIAPSFVLIPTDASFRMHTYRWWCSARASLLSTRSSGRPACSLVWPPQPKLAPTLRPRRPCLRRLPRRRLRQEEEMVKVAKAASLPLLKIWLRHWQRCCV